VTHFMHIAVQTQSCRAHAVAAAYSTKIHLIQAHTAPQLPLQPGPTKAYTPKKLACSRSKLLPHHHLNGSCIASGAAATAPSEPPPQPPAAVAAGYTGGSGPSAARPSRSLTSWLTFREQLCSSGSAHSDGTSTSTCCPPTATHRTRCCSAEPSSAPLRPNPEGAPAASAGSKRPGASHVVTPGALGPPPPAAIAAGPAPQAAPAAVETAGPLPAALPFRIPCPAPA